MAMGRILVDRAENDDVEAIWEPLLSRVAETKRFNAIYFHLNEGFTLDNEIDERIFDVLVYHPQITDVMIDLSIDPESVLHMYCCLALPP